MQTDNIMNSINAVLEKLYKSVEGQVYPILDNLADISPNILTAEPLKNLLFEGNKSTMILIASTFITISVIYYVISRLIAMYNYNEVENPYKFGIKLIIGAILMVSSRYICTGILEINYLFTTAIAEFGKQVTGSSISFVSLRETIINLEKYMTSDFVSLDGMIKSFIAFGTITLVVNFSIRYVTIIFLIYISPLALIFTTSSMTAGIAKSWIKTYMVNLVVQIFVKLILIIPLAFKKADDIVFKIIIIGAIFLLYKINNFTREILGNITGETRRR